MLFWEVSKAASHVQKGSDDEIALSPHPSLDVPSRPENLKARLVLHVTERRASQNSQASVKHSMEQPPILQPQAALMRPLTPARSAI